MSCLMVIVLLPSAALSNHYWDKFSFRNLMAIVLPLLAVSNRCLGKLSCNQWGDYVWLPFN